MKVGISDIGMAEGPIDTKLKRQTKTSKPQKLTPQFQPLTEMEQVEYNRLQRKALSKSTERVFFNPEDYGAVKSTPRGYINPLWHDSVNPKKTLGEQ